MSDLRSAGDEEVERDVVADLFRPGAPDVAVTALQVQRSTITRLSGPEVGPQLSWAIDSVPFVAKDEDDRGHLFLFGDLAIHDGPYFVAVTVSAGLTFRDGRLPFDRDDTTAWAAHTERLGAWASCILYDLAAQTARGLKATVPGCTAHIPIITPEATYMRPDED